MRTNGPYSAAPAHDVSIQSLHLEFPSRRVTSPSGSALSVLGNRIGNLSSNLGRGYFRFTLC